MMNMQRVIGALVIIVPIEKSVVRMFRGGSFLGSKMASEKMVAVNWASWVWIPALTLVESTFRVSASIIIRKSMGFGPEELSHPFQLVTVESRSIVSVALCFEYWKEAWEERYEMTPELRIIHWQLMAFSNHSRRGCGTLVCGLPTVRVNLILTDHSVPWDSFHISPLKNHTKNQCGCFAWFRHWSPVWCKIMGLPVQHGNIEGAQSLWRRDGCWEPIRMLGTVSVSRPQNKESHSSWWK